MTCHFLPGGGIWCGPNVVGATVKAGGKTVYFDFDERFGPLLTDKRGQPLKKQPISDHHPFWRPFNEWLAEWQKANPPKPPKPGPTDHLDRSRPTPESSQ